MKRNKCFCLIVFLIFCIFGLHAQFGIQVGYIYSPTKGNLELGTYKEITGTTRNNGFQAGVTYDFNIKGEFSLQTALLYSYTGGKTKQEQRTINGIYGTQTIWSTFQFLDLPIRLAYNLPVTNDFRFFFFAGPVLSYGFYGKIDEWQIEGRRGGSAAVEKKKPEYNIYDSNGFKDNISPFNLEVGGGLGVYYHSFRFKIGYDFGILNMYTGSARNGKLRRGQLSVAFGYLF